MRADARCFRSFATCFVQILFPTWRRGAHSINYAEDPHLSLIMLFCGGLLTDAVIVCLSHSSLFHPFIFPHNPDLRNPSVGPCYFSYITSFYSHYKYTFCHLWPVSHKGEKRRKGWGGEGEQTRLKNILLYFSSYLMQL